jgi:hypothetical protein
LKSDKTIGERILEYLAEHPGARDTPQGIAEWWLLSSNTRQAVADVEDALRDLVARNRVSVTRGSDGSALYSATSRVVRGKRPSDKRKPPD